MYGIIKFRGVLRNMKDSDSFNLFSSNPNKKPARPKQDAASNSLGPKPNADQALEHMRKLHAELNLRIDKMYELSQKDPKEVNEYFSNPRNFTSQQWVKIQERKEELEAFLEGVPRSEVQKKKMKKEISKMSKDRKGKTLGARKKWMPMR